MAVTGVVDQAVVAPNKSVQNRQSVPPPNPHASHTHGHADPVDDTDSDGTLQRLPYVACYNCSKFHCPYDRMIKDRFNNVFCSPDCGWSFLFRPAELVRQANQAARLHNSRSRRRSGRQGSSSRSGSSRNASSGARRPPRGPRPAATEAAQDQAGELYGGNCMFDFDELAFGGVN